MAVLTVLEGDSPVELLGKSKLKRKLRKLRRKTGHVISKAGRGIGHGVATAGRGIGHGVAQAARVSKRVIKRIVRKSARALLLHGFELGQDSITTMSKGAAVTAVTTAGTAAVGLAFTPAAAAGAAPIIASAAKEAVDEIYAKVKKKVAGGASPAQAAAEVETTFKDEPPGFEKYMIPVGIVILALLLLSGKKSAPSPTK